MKFLEPTQTISQTAISRTMTFFNFALIEFLLLKAKPDSPEHHYVPSGQFNRGLMNQKDRSSIEGFLPGQGGGGIPTSPRYAGSDTSPRARSRGRSITPDQLIHDEK